eukprot:461423-Amphidinium_carterae.2
MSSSAIGNCEVQDWFVNGLSLIFMVTYVPMTLPGLICALCCNLQEQVHSCFDDGSFWYDNLCLADKTGRPMLGATGTELNAIVGWACRLSNLVSRDALWASMRCSYAKYGTCNTVFPGACVRIRHDLSLVQQPTSLSGLDAVLPL